MSPNRILVTGGNGFVGRHCVAALRKRFSQAEIIAGSLRGEDGGPACDLTDRDATQALLKSICPDAIIHLAGQASVGNGSNAATWRANVTGTLNLAEAVVNHAEGCTFLFASSVEVYGASFNNGEVNESTVRRPLSAYSQSKAAAEDLLHDVLRMSARLLIARPCNHSGAGQDERFVIPSFAAQIARIEAGAEPVLFVGNLDARRDFLHVSDVIDAYCGLLSAETRPGDAPVFNIASGRQFRIADILQRLLAMARVPIEVIIDPARMRPSDVPQTRINSDRIRAALGWSPRLELDDILAEVLATQRLAACSADGG